MTEIEKNCTTSNPFLCAFPTEKIVLIMALKHQETTSSIYNHFSFEGLKKQGNHIFN